MLIDGDNAEAKLLDKILEEASKHGTVTVRRIYGDWTSSGMQQWRDAANKHAFQTPHQLNYTTGKNATDTFLIIEAMDLLHSRVVDGFCIVSSDSDFTGLAKRIREQGMFVMGMGRTTTPESFRKGCEVFTHVELLSDRPEMAIAEAQQDAWGSDQSGQGGKPDPSEWQDTVRKAIEMASHEEWNRLADVGNSIVNVDSSFDARAYGSKTLLALIRMAPKQFEVKEVKLDGHPPVHYVRIIRE